MSTLAAPTATAHAPHRIHAALRRAEAAAWVGAAAAVALGAIGLFVTTSSGDGRFQHAGDYWLTADGIVYAVALLVLLPALRTLQRGRDGRLGLAGMAIAGAGAAVIAGMCAYGLAAATGGSLGPTYVIASLAIILGVALFAAGSWRAGLLPHWLVPLWVVAWVVGGTLPVFGPGTLLLAAVDATMAVLLRRRAGAA